MKTKIILLFVTCIVTLSCTKWQGGGEDAIDITADNSIYEGYLYSTYLQGLIDVLEVEKVPLEEIVNNGQADDQILAELEAINAEIKDHKEEQLGILPIVNYAGLDILGPKPPCPDTKCKFPPELRNIISASNVVSEIRMLNGNLELIVKAENPVPLEFGGFEDELSVQTLSLDNYTGPLTVQVVRFNIFGEKITYEVAGEF